MRLTTILMAAACILGGHVRAEDGKFEKDRTAILAMAGEYKVDFHFQETVPLRDDYEVRDRPYQEDAFETVKIAEDSGRRIVLQHILQAGPILVKHWAQIWTYEDTEILEFQGERVWAGVKVEPARAKGKWTQRVTQIDDSPRYEGIGEWIHHPQSSEWTAVANRPKPRREESRDEYDLLVVTNRHTVTPRGWYHEQENVKWVRREGAEYPLCRETGLNTYIATKGHDFAKANTYWEKTSVFWKDVRDIWDGFSPAKGKVRIDAKSGDGKISKIVADMVKKAEDGKAPAVEEIRTALKPFVTWPEG